MISVSLAASEVTAAPTGVVTASVTNGGPAPDRIVLGTIATSDGALAPGDPAWVTVERPLREIAAGVTEQFAVTVTPAPAVAGTYGLKVIAYPADEAPEEYADRGQVLRVLVPVTAPPPPPPPPDRRWLWWVIGGVLLLAVVGGVIWFLNRPDTPPPDEGRAPVSRVVATVDVGFGARGIAIDPVDGVAYVPNSRNSVVFDIPIADPQDVGTLSVEFPSAVAMDVEGRRLYVADSFRDIVVVLDVEADQFREAPSLTSEPNELLAASGTDLLHVATTDGTVEEHDVVRGDVRIAPVGSDPGGMAVDEEFLYVAVQGEDRLSFVDRDTFAVGFSVTVGDAPSHVALDPDTGNLWVTATLDDSIAIVDPEARRIVRIVEDVAVNPEGIAIDAEADAAYVADSSGRITVVDTATAEVTGSIELADTPTSLAVDPATGAVVVVMVNRGQVAVLGR